LDKRKNYSFLIYKIDDRFDIEFSKDLLEYVCISVDDISFYKRLMAITSKDERDRWLKNEKHIQPVLQVKILEAEGDYDQILKYVQNCHFLDWHLKDLLTPIISKFPDDCFQIIKKSATSKLEKGQRGRDLYNRIAGWLTFAYQIPGKQEAVIDLAKTLFNSHNRLRA